ncbi:unknown [Clostridium sp. CAG:1013]|nr:unknown [Clostridium sp. CAG:1013]
MPGDKSSGAQHFSRFPGSQDVPQHSHAPIITVLEADAHTGRAFGQFLELLPLLPVDDRRLLGEHVESTLHRQFYHGGVEIVRRAKVNSIQLLPFQHGLHGIVSLPAEFLRESRGPFRTDISAGHKLYAFQMLEHGSMDLGDAAAAHHAYSKITHCNVPPLIGSPSK